MSKGAAKNKQKKQADGKQSHGAAPQHANEAQQLPEKVSFFGQYANILKGIWEEVAGSFKNDIDPQKVAIVKQEANNVLFHGSIYVLVALVVAGVFVGTEFALQGHVYPNTKIAGIDVGLLNIDDARAKIEAQINNYLKAPLTFTLDGNAQSFTAEELGISVNTEQTLNAVPAFRFHENSPLLIAGTLVTKRDLPLQYHLDTDKIIGQIEGKFSLGEKRAKNARLVLNDKDFIIEPESAGKAINGSRFLSELRARLNSVSSTTIALQLEDEQPRVTAAQLEQQKDRLVGLLDNKVTMRADDAKLDLRFSNHLDAVEYKEKTRLKFKDLGISLPIKLGDAKIKIAEDSPVQIASSLELALNGAKIAPYLDEELLKKIEVPTSGVTIAQDENGKITIDGKGEDGRSVPKNRLIAGIDLAANNNIDSVPVPIITEKAPVNISDNLKDLGIKDLLSTGYTTYYGSPANRMFNIKHGIVKYNGMLVKPGEEFSFNKILGNVDGSTGYLPEKIIKKGKIEVEYGGGICQVSTTLYRALLFAGLPITERNPHTLKVSYYSQVLGPGLDATIYPGVSDVKFINDTPASILIQSYAEGAKAYFKLYGTNDGRTTAMDGPYGGGLSYKWYRTIKKGGEETKETIYSQYKPLPPPDPPAAPTTPKPIASANGQG